MGDAECWGVYGAECQDVAPAAERWTCDPKVPDCNYVEAVREPGLSTSRTRIHSGLNSGYAAIGLAALWGVSRVILLGFDFKRGPAGESHWHGDHAGGLANLGRLDRWVREMPELGAGLRRAGVRVLNATRDTAITCFQRVALGEALGKTDPAIVVQGMHGLGDNLHQRAVVRELMREHVVWLETPWPQVYHDLIGDHLHVTSKGSTLRTQAKNAAARRGLYSAGNPPATDQQLRIHYPPDSIRAHGGSVLAAMAAEASVPVGDFRLPVPKAWHVKADAWLAKWKPDRPLMLYRPLNERKEWSGCRNRNPDFASYAALFEAIAPEFFVVSVADFVDGLEWPVGTPVRADAICHRGELDFETLAALTQRAALVFCSPGFMVPLAQAVGTPVVNVVGGYESGESFRAGAGNVPYLPIVPVKPCMCFSHTHACDKRIDMGAAYRAVREFTVRVYPADIELKSIPLNLDGLPTTYANPGEIERLINLARSCSTRDALEIGCNSGRTSAALLRNVPTLRRMVGVDVPQGYVTERAWQSREVPKVPGALAMDDDRFRLFLRSRGSFDLTPEDLGQFDFIFIDGDHGRAAVQHDSQLARACIRPGGIIAWHDFNLSEAVDVREVLNEYRAQGWPIKIIEGTWIAYMQC
jgi:predicted O-methyltransferase YrrM